MSAMRTTTARKIMPSGEVDAAARLLVTLSLVLVVVVVVVPFVACARRRLVPEVVVPAIVLLAPFGSPSVSVSVSVSVFFSSVNRSSPALSTIPRPYERVERESAVNPEETKG